MYSVKKLYTPKTLSEALALMNDIPGLVPLAGGTDVVVNLRKKRAENVQLMSLGKLAELKGIVKCGEDTIRIGAMSTFTELSRSAIIIERLPLLVTAALAMGGPQIQNAATLGGNICNGATSADGAPPLFALDAVLVFESIRGSRKVSITDFYEGPGRVRRLSNELLLSIEITSAKLRRWGSAFVKLSTRKAMDLALLNCAATCLLREDNTVAKATIALGVAAPTPVRCTLMEEALCGKQLTSQVIWEASRLAFDSTNPRNSWRASRKYREKQIGVLAARTLNEAYLAGRERR